jgi:hypothetical protein
MNCKQQIDWCDRLRKILQTKQAELTQLTGFTETLIPDPDLWSTLWRIRASLKDAIDGCGIASRKIEKERDDHDRAAEAKLR